MRDRIAFGLSLGLPQDHAEELAAYTHPHAIQDFISSLAMNPEKDGDTCQSVMDTLTERHAHCIEAAFVAACALWMNGEKPLLMDMQASGDSDHVIALYKSHGCWGAISKSNHVWLRWRDPVYRTLRELAMSYFHEYTNVEKKTLRTYSVGFDLSRMAPEKWVSNPDNCWDVALALDASRHFKLVTPAQARKLKPRDDMELEADRIIEYAI